MDSTGLLDEALTVVTAAAARADALEDLALSAQLDRVHQLLVQAGAARGTTIDHPGQCLAALLARADDALAAIPAGHRPPHLIAARVELAVAALTLADPDLRPVDGTEDDCDVAARQSGPHAELVIDRARSSF